MEVVTQQDVPLAPYTTLKVGGVANYFVVVREVEEVRVAVPTSLFLMVH
jgi:UDP-N-acetylenolpyruvoylglucosamine reductase